MFIVRNKDIRPRKRAPFRARALRTSAEVTTRHMTTHFYISAIHGGLIRTLPVDFRWAANALIQTSASTSLTFVTRVLMITGLCCAREDTELRQLKKDVTFATIRIMWCGWGALSPVGRANALRGVFTSRCTRLHVESTVMNKS